MKTIEEWLNELPEPERALALFNLNPKKQQIKTDDLSIALDHAFDWDGTPEGYHYWDEIYERVKLDGVQQTEIEALRQVLRDAAHAMLNLACDIRCGRLIQQHAADNLSNVADKCLVVANGK